MNGAEIVRATAPAQTARRGASRPLKWLIAFLGLLAIGLLVSVSVVERELSQTILSEGDPGGILIGLAFALIAVVGALAAMGQPRNGLGWTLLASGLAIGLAGLGGTLEQYFRHITPTATAAHIAGWLGALGWYSGVFLLLVFFPLLFPDGRLPRGRLWRPVFLIACLSTATILVLTLIGGLLYLPTGAIAEHNAFQGSVEKLFPFLLPVMLLGVVGLVVRFRQAKGAARQQMKWLVLTMGMTFTAFSLLSLLESVADLSFSNLIWGTCYLVIPIGLGIALLRYRLFDVDTVIRRTTQYVIVSALLALVYFGSVMLLQQLSGTLTGATQSPLATVVSTLFIAALFAPLRRRVQALVDRGFFRQKYVAQQVLAQFALTARDETDLGRLEQELLRAVTEAIRPATLTVWIRAGQADAAKSVIGGAR